MDGFYLDGVQQPADGNANVWDGGSTYTIPEGTRVVGIQCTDLEGGNSEGQFGIKATFNNGLVTDETWDCSPESFNTGMAPAVDSEKTDDVSGIPSSALWIWASGLGHATVYCQYVMIGEYLPLKVKE